MSDAIKNFKRKYPEYNDMTEHQIRSGIRRKYYSDMSLEEFNKAFDKKFSANALEEALKERLMPETKKYYSPVIPETSVDVALRLGALPVQAIGSTIASLFGKKTFPQALKEGTGAGKAITGVEPGFDSWVAAGSMGIDFALDPFNYIGIGWFNKAKQAKKLAEVVMANEAVGQFMSVMKKLPRFAVAQKELTTKGKSVRANVLKEMEKKYEGKELYRRQKKYLKSMSEYETFDFKSLIDEFPEESQEQIFRMVDVSTDLDQWDKLTARRALEKIFGESGGKVPPKSEIAMLRKVFPKELVDEIENKIPTIRDLSAKGLNVLNVPRSAMSTADLSAPLRQGVFFISRPKQFFPAVKDMFKATLSEKWYEDLFTKIKSMDTYDEMKIGKVSFTDLSADLTKREEAIMSNLIEKPWGIGKIARAFNRAHTGFLNQLRANMADYFIKKAHRKGAVSKTDLQQIGSYVNAGSGRGSLTKMGESIAPLLNAVGFSPRLVGSRLQLVGKVFNPNTSSFVRKELLRDWVGFLGVGTTVLSLAKLAGAKVGTNANSADFGKIKIGDTRYDIWGGFQQYAVFLHRMLPTALGGGKVVSSVTGREYKYGEEDYKPSTRGTAVSRFVRYKLSPLASFAWDAFTDRTAIGAKFRLSPAVIDRMVPMITQDLYDLFEEEGMLGAAKATPGVFGVGVQHYGQRVPVPGYTPTGKPTTKWEPAATFGEVVTNWAKGEKKTPLSKEEQTRLQKEREEKIQRNIKIDKAKKQVRKTGTPQWVGDTYIYIDRDGVLKTKKRRKQSYLKYWR